MKVGDKIFFFNLNHRVYNERGSGGPIWREHWQPTVITGETSRSWETVYGKCPKNPKTRDARVWAMDEGEIDLACWGKEHQHKIAGQVERIDDVLLLKVIAGIINYQED